MSDELNDWVHVSVPPDHHVMATLLDTYLHLSNKGVCSQDYLDLYVTGVSGAAGKPGDKAVVPSGG